MNRADRRLLIGLSGAVIALSVPGWKLSGAPLLHTILFYADTLAGMALLTFALATAPTDDDER